MPAKSCRRSWCHHSGVEYTARRVYSERELGCSVVDTRQPEINQHVDHAAGRPGFDPGLPGLKPRYFSAQTRTFVTFLDQWPTARSCFYDAGGQPSARHDSASRCCSGTPEQARWPIQHEANPGRRQPSPTRAKQVLLIRALLFRCRDPHLAVERPGELGPHVADPWPALANTLNC
jgi:hypothetical protein